MRKNSYLVAPMALAVAITFSSTGQEEPLPVVHAKTSGADLPVPQPAPYLTVALNRPFDSSLLAEAARANDFAAFDALYRGARKLGQPVNAYSTLHELWSWSMSDPIGAFYGRETYLQFANAFPGYSRYIEEYSIVDNHGDVFYPTSETRAFLLARALEGKASSTPVITRTARAQSRQHRDTTTSAASTTPHSSSTRATTQPSHSATHSSAAGASTSSSVPRGHHSRKVQTDVASKPAPSTTATTKPSKSTPAASKPAASKSAVSSPVATTPAVQTPAAQTPALQAPATTSTPTTSNNTTTAAAPATPVVDTAATTEAPVVVKAEEPAPATAVPATETQAAPQPASSDNPFSSRGMLLLVIGLIGFGVLALILRTPKEVPTSILPPADGTKPPAPVEPFRKTPAPGSPKSEDSTKPRATGSRG